MWIACNKTDSRIEYLFRTCPVVTNMVTSLLLIQLCRAAVLWWIRSYSVFISHLSTAYLNSTNTTNGYGAVPDITSSYSSHLGKTSSAPSFSSFLKKQKTQKLFDDEMSMNMIIKRNFVQKSWILYFYFLFIFQFQLFYFTFLKKEILSIFHLWIIQLLAL